ncbi:dienelactone hydrolase family protein [Solibacillus daqui]|uniref:dienelactone hydrolase family protein n=1 Tax=Solibacillus daqui TaxID=2912187 RepID=UPI002366796C|nr:dienelactone hydrolase family protein [Solibacillus daqui]
MELKQNSSRCIVLLHEIYGINQHMEYYAKLFYKQKFDVYIPNLINNETSFPYEEEERAYRHFIENVGFEKAYKQVIALIDALSKEYIEIHVIGFSVGATVAWLCSNHENVHRVVGFYGSRIRQYLGSVPKCETILIYGEHEKSFDPKDLKRNLSQYSNVLVKIVEGGHGFADPYSKNYNKISADRILKYLAQ